ncbi:hypothetical protein OG357_22585 [Streptomyces sp. NBC_01255]|uniref:hypothetical protein n=1 Tax=Streptomyces sp. NBC_01255 TaxID=2903798 RepID=UPI002E306F58|nr:hypothetical protein [Streptomyces sp. NBC_01255]
MNTFDATDSTELDASWDGVVIPERVRNRTAVALAVGDSLRRYVPQRPGCYLRTSCDRRGDEKGIDLQLQDVDRKRIDLAWGPFAQVYRENDTGAFKKKRLTKSDGTADWMVIRPAFRRMLSDLLSGEIDGLDEAADTGRKSGTGRSRGDPPNSDLGHLRPQAGPHIVVGRGLGSGAGTAP